MKKNKMAQCLSRWENMACTRWVFQPRPCFFIYFFFVIAFGCVSGNHYRYESIVRKHSPSPVSMDADSSMDKERPDETPFLHPLTVSDAIQIGLKNNPDLDIAVARIRQSEALIAEAQASFWPSFSLYVEYVKADAPSTYLFKKIDQRQLPSPLDFNHPGRIENVEAGISGRLNIYRGGRDLLQKKLAETGLRIEQLDRMTVKNALVASIIQSFYTVLAAKDLVSVSRKSVETVQAQLRIMKVQYEGGSVLKSDVLSLEVRLAEARENLIRAENQEKLSRSALANLLGSNPDTAMTLSEEEWQPATTPDQYPDGLVQALGRRPELLMARRQLVRSALAIELEKSNFLPTVDAHGKYYHDDSGLQYNHQRQNWVAGVIVNWDIFTGLSTKSRVEKAKAVMEEMMAYDRKTSLSVQIDVKRAYLKLSEAKARREVTQASVAQAEETFDLVKKQYEGGAATVTRYLDAELALNAANVRSISAYYDLKKAQADVARAVGYYTHLAREESHEQ